MKNLLCLILVASFIFGCSHETKFSSSRRPASEKLNLEELISKINSAIGEGTSSTIECSSKLTSYYQRLFNLRSTDIELSKLSQSEIKNIISLSFDSRLQIKEKMKSLVVDSVNSKKCLSSIKDMVRALRYVEDYMVELEYSSMAYFNKMDFVTLSGEGSLFLKNPKYSFDGVQDLKSGDIILSRGNAYSSAAIARIGQNDTQFSHLSFVYEHSDKKMYTVEAHIEIGSVVAPVQVNIDQKNARSVVFRHKDSKLAHQAAKLMFERVKKRQDKKKNIEYDFGMDYKDDKRIFCSEIVSEGFNKASKKIYKKELILPKHKTKFNRGLIPFLQILGIKINEKNIETFETFGPGDIQFDPSFDIVAEWRNPKKMRDNRFKDAVLTKMFQWMENENYKLHPPAGLVVKSRFSWLMRRTPFVKKMLEEKFPMNMNSKQLRLFLALDLVGEKFYNVVSDKQIALKKVLSPIEIYDILEEFKSNDFQRYMKYKQLVKRSRRYGPRSKVPYYIKKEIKETRPVFHRYFHN
jgi:hypothetical protein